MPEKTRVRLNVELDKDDAKAITHDQWIRISMIMSDILKLLLPHAYTLVWKDEERRGED